MPVIEILLPADWSEIIKSGKYREVIKLLNTPFESEAHARFEMMKLLTGMNGFDLGKQLGAGNSKQRNKVAELISIEDAMEVAEKVFPAMDFIFGNEKFFVNPFPTFKHKGITYQGPDSGRLSDQTGEEWMVSHQQLWLYSQIQDVSTSFGSAQDDSPMKHLRMMVAANYHRVMDGKRSSFSEAQLDQDAEALKDLPDEIVLGIVMWYNHADAWWADNFAWLFTSEGKQGMPTEEPDGKEIRHLLFDLSGNKIDDAWDVILKRSRQDIIYALDRLEQRREEMEEAAEAAK